MSLVLEALRRVEKPDTQAGSAGAAVAPMGAPGSRVRSVIPLILGLTAGGIAVALSTPSPKAPVPAELEEGRVRAPRGRAGLPPPIFPSLPEPPRVVPRDAASARARAESPRIASRTVPGQSPSTPRPADQGAAPTFVLQGISERDSYPIAIINDQLVKEGDLLGKVRVLKIGAESVEMVLENGETVTVSFAPPPPPEPSPTPDKL